MNTTIESVLFGLVLAFALACWWVILTGMVDLVKALRRWHELKAELEQLKQPVAAQKHAHLMEPTISGALIPSRNATKCKACGCRSYEPKYGCVICDQDVEAWARQLCPENPWDDVPDVIASDCAEAAAKPCAVAPVSEPRKEGF